MKRLTLKLALFLVLGAIVNVAVAWGCAIWSPLRVTDVGGEMILQHRFGATDRYQILGDSAGSPYMGSVQLQTDFVDTQAGWPSRSTLLPLMNANAKSVALLASLPLWPGFAINTVFYAFILWLLFALGGTPFALRRRRRIKRGLCPKCAYDLRGSGKDSTACPECGAAAMKPLGSEEKRSSHKAKRAIP